MNIEITNEKNSCWSLWVLESWEIKKYALAEMPQSDENLTATTEQEAQEKLPISILL